MVYKLTITEEGICNPNYEGHIAGRIEVYDDSNYPYAVREIRFLTKKVDEFYDWFEHDYEGEWINEHELDFAIETVKERFYKNN